MDRESTSPSPETDRAIRLRRESLRRLRRRTSVAEGRRALVIATLSGAGVLALLRLAAPLPDATVIGLLLSTAIVALGLAAWRMSRRSPELDRHLSVVWQDLSEAAGEEPGLIAALESALDRQGTTHPPFEAVIIARGGALSPPSTIAIQNAIPAITPIGVIASVALLALVGFLPSATRLPPMEPTVGSTGPAGEWPPVQVTGETMRAAIQQREEWAQLLEGSTALAPLATALREGGTLPALGPLSAEDRRRLDRMIALGKLRGADSDEIAALEAMRDGFDDPRSQNWTAPGALPPEAKGDLARGGTGTPETSSPELADGGREDGDDRSASPDDPPSPENPKVPEAPVTSEGRAIGEGSQPNAGASVASTPRDTSRLDATRAWARRLELESRWIPVIEAYRREDERR